VGIASNTGAAPVAFEVMGGDHGPAVAVEAAVMAAAELGVKTVLVGDQNIIEALVQKAPSQVRPLISIRHAPDVVTMEDSASVAIRRKPNSSIRVAFRMLAAGEASACVSAGNTGAMMAAGMYECGTLPGIARPAIASMIPRRGGLPPCVLLDCGANVDCHSNQLVQFALMGGAFASVATAVPEPRVALLSNGSEPGKGTDIIRAAAECLRTLPSVKFVGYVEGRDLVRDVADVVVCDGFVGNVLLKAMEGTVDLVVGAVKDELPSSLRAKLGLWLAGPLLKKVLKGNLDPASHGGAPLLGLKEIGIVCHGSSDRKAFYNALRVAHEFSVNRLTARLEDALASIDIPEEQTL
jgi:glycerol-3-phosphate acyltransferase PlsX